MPTSQSSQPRKEVSSTQGLDSKAGYHVGFGIFFLRGGAYWDLTLFSPNMQNPQHQIGKNSRKYVFCLSCNDPPLSVLECMCNVVCVRQMPIRRLAILPKYAGVFCSCTFNFIFCILYFVFCFFVFICNLVCVRQMPIRGWQYCPKPPNQVLDQEQFELSKPTSYQIKVYFNQAIKGKQTKQQ